MTTPTSLPESPAATSQTALDLSDCRWSSACS
jgi:hypothetical protein